MTPTTTHKAWASATTTLIVTAGAMFGFGEMPPPATIEEAVTSIGMAGVSAAASWFVTWLVANKPKKPKET